MKTILHGSTRGFPLLLAALVCSVMVSALDLAARQVDTKRTDVKGSRDHPMISRVDGSTISGFSQKEFDEYRFVTGPLSGYRPDGRQWTDLEEALNDENSLRLEGQVWRLTYRIPTNRSTLEVIRSYEAELTKAGFKVLFQCSGKTCAGEPPKGASDNSIHARALRNLLMKRANFTVVGGGLDDQRYIAARLPRKQGDIYACVMAFTLNTPVARLDVVEAKPMESSLVTVDAAAMAAEISKRGSVALYGIYFDTDKADLKPASRPTLSEIAALLQQNSTLELIVVGHTDNNGTFEHNLDLSRRRAQAVVTALTAEFGVARNRLEAHGVGYLAPVAPNTSEDGRSRNRRVQLLSR
jgi:OmpA-OmpF porin, OOP family